MDNQTSMDGDRNGAFTGMLKKVWNGGRFAGNYRALRDKIVSLMPSSQTPNYYRIGDMYADRLREAGQASAAAQVRSEVEAGAK